MVPLHILRDSSTPGFYRRKAFFYGLGVAFLFFIPFIIFDQGYFLFYGDFNVQQVPFYQMCHDSIRNGEWGWNWKTDLGANFIGSYTFYLLGSPFFWLTIPFPSWMVPHLMGPLLILKFGCATLTSYVYLERYAKHPDYAIIGAMLYAFSGFSVYNIFFNHFHEAIIFFPLMLWALDEYMYERRRCTFAITVFLCCTVNYYFFVGQVVFLLIYWTVRMLSGSWTITMKDFLLLFCESVIGVLCSCLLLIPTILAVLQNPRISDPPNGWGALLYDYNQRYLHILECFFFPPDIPARPNFTPNSEAKWASLGAWLPLFSMSGVIAFLQYKKKHWLKTMLLILFLMAGVPVLNAAFQLFNMAYYARWYYMLTLMMSLATIACLQYADVDWRRAIHWTLGITLGIALPIGLMPRSVSDTDTAEKKLSFGLEDYPTRFWAYVAVALLSLALLVMVFQYYQRNRRKFLSSCMLGIALVSVIYSAYFIALGKTQSDDTHHWIIPYSLNKGADIHLPDSDQFSRVDVYDGMDNQAMFWQKPTIQCFHSIVPGSVMEFYPTIGVQRDVASRPDTSVYGLRGLTSCRWLFCPSNSNQSFTDSTGKGVMPGWSYYDTQNGCTVYQNDYYIPMGFSYDYYITRSEYDSTNQAERHLLLLKAIVLEDSDIFRYGSTLKHLDLDTQSYTEEEYYKDCLARKATSCSSFEYDSSGFTAKFNSNTSRIVFFSVPYENGWSAEVNGKKVDIIKSNVGFMSVEVPAGTSVIHFTYQTPGLKLGAAVSAGGIALLLFYWYFTKPTGRRKGQIEQDPVRQTDEVQ
ncbi:YfhO family protein [Thermocaproicibacter melissae]|uniref:YfhO family protein n=1 Tax=Thermocaproicibacter melissae TaxID=2966552 RepID=UPI0024B11A54|nr:YfhO family protein [Thermocaproicibacter melissae]WBY63608.1 YfhO family protein [Thermocaproicibacter melissae]